MAYDVEMSFHLSDFRDVGHHDIKFEVTWRPGKKNPADFPSCDAMSLNQLSRHIREEENEFNKLCWLLHGSPYIEAISVESLQCHTKMKR